MANNRRIKAKLRRELCSLTIPSKESVLPNQAFSQAISMKSVLKPVLVKAFSVIAVASLVTIIAFREVQLLSVNPSNGFKNPILSRSDSMSEHDLEKVLVTANVFDNFIISSGEGLLSSRKIYISDMLQEKMEQYKGQDVLFRVVVGFPITKEDYDNYKNEVSSNSAREESIRALEKELNQKWDEYYALLEKYKNPDSSDSVTLAMVTEKEAEVKALSKRLSELKEQDKNEYYTKTLEERMEFAKSAGAKNIESIAASSDEVSHFRATYFMELSEDIIMRMAEHGGYTFRLASPKRIAGYDNRISDSLTVLLEQLGMGGTIHVAVVCDIDKFNEFTVSHGIPCNPQYNSNLNHAWEGEALNNENVENYINSIVERSNMKEKRIRNENATDANVISKDVIVAGFEAQLTKEEIVNLVSDNEIKVIYPMKSLVNNNAFGADE